MSERMTFGRAINRGMHRALAEDPKVLLMGEDIGALGGVFRITDGLQEEFGKDRVVDTPLAEAGIVGTAVGLAMRGYRPVVEIQFDGFVYPAFDQIVANLAKLRARTRGAVPMPVTIRIPFGGGIGSPEHHSESPEAYFMHTPGLRVVSPSSPQDGYDMIRGAIASDDPVVYLEPKRRYHDKGDVDVEAPVPPLSPARVLRPGRDVTLVAYGPLVKTALQAAEVAAEEGVEVEVVDLRSLSPLDTGLVESSVRRTGRLVVAHEASRTGGLGAELVATVAERAFHWLESLPVRVTGLDIPYPPAKLEHLHLPDLDRILDGLDRAMGRPNALDSVDVFAPPQTAEQFLAAQAAGTAGEETPMSQKTFRLPDLGEGLTESDIAQWRVAVGDAVTVNQILAEVETAKAVVEVSSPFEGVVAELHAEEGATVEVGTPLVTFTVEGAGDDDGDGGRVPTLVGYGAAPDAGKPGRRARRGGSPSTTPEPANEGAARPQPEPELPPVPQDAPAVPEAPAPKAPAAAPAAPAAPAARVETPAPAPASGERPRCTPPVRLYAKRAGVALEDVTGTGAGGAITREDVEAALRGGAGAAETVPDTADAATGAAETAPSAAPATGEAGGVRTLGGRPREVDVPVKGVRKATAAAMVRSAFTAPHVTEFLQVDVTESLELLAELKQDRAFRDVKLTPMTLTARACILAMERTPDVNARWDEERGVIVQQNAVNFGFAAATPRGLMVPNVKDAQALDLRGLAQGIAGLTERARAGALAPADLSGGTFTLTNVGVFGVDTGTPIINPGEAAILCLGAVRRTPWEHRGEIALRDVLTLSLSFDHRLVDGEQGSRFLADVGAMLRRPGMTLALV